MLFQTIGQWRVFLWMLAAGAAIGAWYGLLAGLRRLLDAGVWLSLMADVAFGLGAAAIFCLALYLANYAALRLYAVAAVAMGFAIFMLGAFPASRRAASACGQTIRHIIVKIRRFRWINVIFR